MTVLITLTIAGSDSGPFNLFSNLDGYTSAFEIGVSKASLLAGYSSSLVPDYTTIIRIKSTGVCNNYIDIVLDVPPTTTTTTSSPVYYCKEYTAVSSGGGSGAVFYVDCFGEVSDFPIENESIVFCAREGTVTVTPGISLTLTGDCVL